jgi:quercetin dioxygenase-like cupin family protein
MIVKAGDDGYNELLPGVRLKTLTHGPKTHLTEVRFVAGAMVPEHQHPEEQTGYLVDGRLRFFGADGETVVAPGDSWTFEAGVPHGAEALEDSVVVEMFSPVREDYLALAAAPPASA